METERVGPVELKLGPLRRGCCSLTSEKSGALKLRGLVLVSCRMMGSKCLETCKLDPDTAMGSDCHCWVALPGLGNRQEEQVSSSSLDLTAPSALILAESNMAPDG